MFKSLTITTITLLASISPAETYFSNGKALTKVEAVKALLANPNTNVERCNQVQLTDKVTLKNVPKNAKK